MRQNDPIHRLCDSLDKYPDGIKGEIIGRACKVVGEFNQPTGLQSDGTTPISRLYWDLETIDLRKRLYHLAESELMYESVLVDGVLRDLIRFHSGFLPGSETAARKLERSKEYLLEIEAELALPESERKTPTKRLLESRASTADWVATWAERCERHARTVQGLRQLQATYTDEYWRQYEHEMMFGFSDDGE